jgi:gliding motility-associatede transport system auxiliary component
MMSQPSPTAASFSSARKWNIGLNLSLAILSALAILGMVNYLAARHFMRFAWSGRAQTVLSPLTTRILGSLTNDVEVTVFFDKENALYEMVHDLLKEYQYANPRLSLRTVDYVRDPAAAKLVKAKYSLNEVNDKDLVIFESGGKRKIVYENELSELDVQPLVSGRSREVKRTHFKGEVLFTSALLNVTSLRSLKAYFLLGHREHSTESTDADVGYSKFAELLRDNNILPAALELKGTNEIPLDCNLLILAGPSVPMQPPELRKIDHYLKNGGRALVLLNFYGIKNKANAGLLDILADWGVKAGNDLVQDLPNSNTGQDIVIGEYGVHSITKPLLETRLHLVVPRSVRKAAARASSADTPNITELLFTGPKGTVIDDVRDGVPYPHPGADEQTNVCLAVAVEKGKIRDVTAERGTTRLVVVGDSFFLNNRMIDSAANRDFAALAINWLTDRSELLSGLGPRPIKEYRLNVTRSHLLALRWILLLGLPGSVVLAGFIVWTRRRR